MRVLDAAGTALVVLGLALMALAVTMLAGLWWGLLAGSVECLVSGLALCALAARMPVDGEKGGGSGDNR